MLSERQNNILKIIILEYIKTVKPVGSTSINEKLNCSSATVRSEMNYLEEVGLLEKTHTSSGRVPSEKGYRYYVDNLMKPVELNGEDMLKLQTIFHNQSLVISDSLVKSMEIVSEITNCAVLMLGELSSENRVTKVEVVPINQYSFVAVIITDKGHVENRTMTLDEKVSVDEVKTTVEIINKLIVGTPLSEVGSKLEFEVKPVISKYVKQHDALYDAFYTAFSDFTIKTNSKLIGTSNVIKEPEFNDVEQIKKLLTKFDDEETINNIKETDDGINIYIGSENEVSDDVTVIKTKYNFNNQEGTLAVIGPKRMDYDRIIMLIDYLKKNMKGD